MSDGLSWPEPANGQSDNEKALYKAKLDRIAAIDDAQLAINQAFLDGVVEVAKESIERARAGADTVQKAAAAIVTVYTAVLGVTFSVTEKPLPSRGVIAPILLGTAIVLSTVYLAYISKPDDDVDPPVLGSDPYASATATARSYILWTRAGTMTRRYWIRASVVTLGVALLFLPAPYVTFEASEAKKPTKEETANLPAYPKVPKTGDRQLRAILYRAQVKEVADQRAKPAPTVTREGHDGLWWLAGGIGLGLALLAPLAISRIVSDPSGDPAAGKLPTYLFHE